MTHNLSLARTRFRLMSIAPDFTDTGDGDDDVNGVTTATKHRGGDDRSRQRQHVHEAADREERRADLFAGLGPVAVFSARHRYTRPRWVKMVRGSRHRSTASDTVGAGDDHDESPATVDPIQLVDRWFGFELRSHGGGATATVPPASVGHVRSNSQAQVIYDVYFIFFRAACGSNSAHATAALPVLGSTENARE